MRRLLVVLRREYLERVRSRAFVIGTLLGPLLLLALSLGPSLLLARQHGQALRVAVLDDSERLGPSLERVLRARQDGGQPRFDLRSPEVRGERRFDVLRQEILAGRLDGYVYIPADGIAHFSAEYRGRNLSNLAELGLLQDLLETELRRLRLRDAGLAPTTIEDLTQRLRFKRIQVSERGEREDHGASFLLAFTLMMALYSALAMWGAALMNGVIEEKANRVVEVVISSVPTTTLFAGKLLGVGAVGLTQLGAWSLFAGLLGLLGAGVAAPSLPEVRPLILIALLVFFLLGFFLYGALYMAVGAAVNSQQEAQSLAFPVMLPLILGIMLFPAVLNSPDSAFAVAVSLVPFWTPLLMFLRMSATNPPLWQTLLGIGLTLATIVVATVAAARIYRVGILMYGKRPTLPELLRWIPRR